MLKLGVCRRDQFFAEAPRGWWPYVRYRLSRSRVSLDLLRAFDSESAERDANCFERLMPHVRLSGGVYKTTYGGRFRNLDPIVNRVLAERFHPGDQLQVEDWAASACLTSAEWARTLFQQFPCAQLRASDLALVLISAENNSGEVFVLEPEGRPLQYIKPPFVIRLEPPEPWGLPLNRLLYLRAQAAARKVSGLRPLPDDWLSDPGNEAALERNGWTLRKLLLIHPQAMALARSDSRFTIGVHSVFEPSAKPCHVIRTMNILNRSYFPEERLAAASLAVTRSLIPGGIWIVGRTTREDPPEHEVTIFGKLADGALEVIERMGPGSEIESLALSASKG